jgi:hypothetical protein
LFRDRVKAIGDDSVRRTPSGPKLQYVLDRVMHVWSLIKMVPEPQLSAARSLLAAHLLNNAHLTDDELVVVGLKYLHRLDDPKGGFRRGINAKDNAAYRGAFSDKTFLERLAKTFPKPGDE